MANFILFPAVTRATSELTVQQHAEQVMDQLILHGIHPTQTVNDELVYKTMGISLKKSERVLLTDTVQIKNTCVFSRVWVFINGWCSTCSWCSHSWISHILGSVTGELSFLIWHK